MASEKAVSRSRHSLFTFLLVLTCLRVWIGPIEWTPRAHAQLPDSAKQRNASLAAARRTNELLSEIVRILTVEEIKVVVDGSDKKPAGVSPVPRGRSSRVPVRR
jgi:hypothetical protein